MYLVSGISGEPLYAAMASSSEEWLGASSKLDASAYNSAQFYSTSNPSGFIDGASASAIASAYQVVSSTATQLYAGTAYVTSVNDAPISASRAGNAANASLANSAWYDGTGRLISALPDSAAVSAIASSYVESGVSSKQDTLSFEYNTADQISSINGSALGGMDEAAVSGIASAYAESAVSSVSGNYYTTANESGYVGSAYVDSAVSSKADSSALSSYVPYSSLEYNTASAISGINGSALAAGSTYSAGEGIDITDDVISVEAPVDIVAGPGIVIDNPDGNTLRVSTEADYEVVLWETTSSGVDSGSITVSEAITNFEKYEIYGFETERGGTFVNTFAYSQIPFDYSSLITKPTDNNGQYAFSINMFCAGNISQWRQTYFGCRCHWNSTFTQMTIDSNHGAFVNKDANGTFNSINQKLRITKIVGINRIANN